MALMDFKLPVFAFFFIVFRFFGVKSGYEIRKWTSSMAVTMRTDPLRKFINIPPRPIA